MPATNSKQTSLDHTNPEPVSITTGVPSCSLVNAITKKIFHNYHNHRNKLAFTPGENNPNAPQLGQFTNVDLRISNHTTESYEWKKALIASAKVSIEISANFTGGKALKETLNLIEERMELFPDLKCHFLMSKDMLTAEDIVILGQMKERNSNFNYLITDRIANIGKEPSTEENHVKMVLVDGKYFAMGGSGIHERMAREEIPNNLAKNQSISDKVLDQAFRDTDIIGNGEVAETMRNQFFNLYRIWEFRMQGADIDRYFPGQPDKSGRCELFHEEEGLIKNSRSNTLLVGQNIEKRIPFLLL